MRKITATLRPFKLFPVMEALHVIGIQGLTASEARVYHEPTDDFVPMIAVEVVVPIGQLNEVVDTIQNTAAVKKEPTGTIVISLVQLAVRIRTNEAGVKAVMP